jgi:hypothetical protein
VPVAVKERLHLLIARELAGVRPTHRVPALLRLPAFVRDVAQQGFLGQLLRRAAGLPRERLESGEGLVLDVQLRADTSGSPCPGRPGETGM